MNKTEIDSELLKLAEEGDVKAQEEVGQQLLNRNNKEGYEWMKRAAMQGDESAFLKIVCTLNESNRIHKEVMAYWVEKAIKGDSKAQYSIGLYNRSKKKMSSYSLKLAPNDDIIIDHYELGKMFEKGIGVKQSYKSAYSCYKHDVKYKLGPCTYKLGILHFFGLGVEQSYEKAVRFFKRGADKDYRESKFMLAICYKVGLGVEQNDEEAERLYNLTLGANPKIRC